MDLYLSSPIIQLLVLAFIAIFTVISFKKPSFALRLFPIILPFYLIKLYLNLQLISEAIKSHSLLMFINSFFNPLYKEYPVLPPNFGEAKTTALPTNLLEITIIIFLIINLGLVFKGIRILKKTRLGKYFLSTCYFLLFTVVLSTFFGLNQKVSLGIAKSWFFLPFFLFLALLPYLSIPRFREKYLKSLALGGVVIVALNLPFLLFDVLTYDHRLSGIYLSPNHLGMALVPGFLALVVLIVKNETWNMKHETKHKFQETHLGEVETKRNKLPAQASRLWRQINSNNQDTNTETEVTGSRVKPGMTHHLMFYVLCFMFYIILLYATTSYSTWLGLFGALFFLVIINKKNVAQYDSSKWKVKSEKSWCRFFSQKWKVESGKYFVIRLPRTEWFWGHFFL